jgi:hypothetical protein
LPKVTLVGLTVNAAGETPEPVRPTLRLGFDALLLTVRLPVAVPVAVGLKVTLSDVDCPAASVSGRVGCVTANPVPVTLTWLIVPLEPPALVIWTVLVAVVEVVTEPKSTLEGDALNVAEETPEPVSPTLRLGSDALLLMLRLPVVVPVDVGLNLTLNVVDWPGPRLRGRATAPTEKPVPLVAT